MPPVAWALVFPFRESSLVISSHTKVYDRPLALERHGPDEALWGSSGPHQDPQGLAFRNAARS